MKIKGEGEKGRPTATHRIRKLIVALLVASGALAGTTATAQAASQAAPGCGTGNHICWSV